MKIAACVVVHEETPLCGVRPGLISAKQPQQSSKDQTEYQDVSTRPRDNQNLAEISELFLFCKAAIITLIQESFLIAPCKGSLFLAVNQSHQSLNFLSLCATSHIDRKSLPIVYWKLFQSILCTDVQIENIRFWFLLLLFFSLFFIIN